MRRPACLDGGALASALFLLTTASYSAQGSPSITVDPPSATAGQRVSIKGTGWPQGEFVALYFDPPGVYLDHPGPIADANGAIDDTVLVPPGAPGQHSVCGDTAYAGASQPVAAKACTTFIVLAAPAAPAPATAPASPSSNPPAANPHGIGLIGGAVLLALLGAAVLWRRRAR